MRQPNSWLIACVSIAVLSVGALFGCERGDSESESEKQTTKQPAQNEPEPSSDATKSVDGKRIVSIGGTVTEIVYALGAGDQVVAVDRSSLYPKETEKVRHLNLFRNVSAEGVLSYEPELVLATENAQPDKAFDRIKQAGATVHRITGEETIEAAKERISTLGDILQASDKAESLITTLDDELEQAKTRAESCQSPARTLFLYARGRGSTFVAGKDSSAQRMIELAGATHVPKTIEGFKPMSAEAVIKAKPEVILMTDSGLKSMGGESGLSQVKGLGETPAMKQKRIVTMGDLALLGFGPRTGKVVGQLAERLCLNSSADAGK